MYRQDLQDVLSGKKKNKVQDIQDGHHLYFQQGDMHTDTHTQKGREKEGGRQPVNLRKDTQETGNSETVISLWRAESQN